MAAQKLEIVQLKEAVLQLVADKTSTGQRLDSEFNHVDAKYTEVQLQTRQLFELVDKKLQTITDTMSQFAMMAPLKP